MKDLTNFYDLCTSLISLLLANSNISAFNLITTLIKYLEFVCVYVQLSVHLSPFISDIIADTVVPPSSTLDQR